MHWYSIIFHCHSADHLSPHIFPDSETARADSFLAAIDGSNDTDTEKMNPITMKIFDETQGMIVSDNKKSAK